MVAAEIGENDGDGWSIGQRLTLVAGDHPLILTLEFGHGVTPGARLTRVLPLRVGATPHQWPEISSDTERPLRADIYRMGDHYQPYITPRAPDGRYDNRRREVNHLRLDSLTKLPSEILATELQLRLPSCPPTLEIALESEKLNHLIKDVRQRGSDKGKQTTNNNGRRKVINMVRQSNNGLKRKSLYKQSEEWIDVPITFPPISTDDVSDGPLIVEAEVEGYWIRMVFMDQGAAKHCFDNLSPDIKAQLALTQTELVGFSGKQLIPIGKIELKVCFGGGWRTCLLELWAISSTIHGMMKFPTPKGIATVCARAKPIYECRWSERKVVEQEVTVKETEETRNMSMEEEEKVLVNPAFPEQTITIGTQFSAKCHEQLVCLLKYNMDVFAWQPSDMGRVPRRLVRYALNVNHSVPPVAQKRRVLGTEKSKVVTKEVEEWVEVGIVRPVQYPTWISNPVLVKKMSKEDEDKTAFYTDQGTYYYVKMSFGLKNVGATYQRLIDSAFRKQLGRNLEAYVDDMVIKSKTEQDMIMNIAEMFDNLRKINMKLNPIKCSFDIGEGKFLGYMVTSEGIRANPKKTKAIADMQSSKTLKEMQSLSGKLAALNRFLSRFAERSLPFFETLKNITKENKEDYRWIEEQIYIPGVGEVHLRVTHTHHSGVKKTLFVYLATSHDAVNGVLVAGRKGKQTPIRYVSRTLHEAGRNYAPLENLALCLLHISRRLRRYFKAHPIKVITDQPIKQILNKPEVSGKLAKYAVEIGVYNITYISRTAVKVGQKDSKGWTLYTNGASSQKGVGAGLVLIDSSGTEYTYAIRLNFPSTNNEAKYETLLAGLRIARKMKVQTLDVQVDSKLVACQMKGEFVASNEGMEKILGQSKRASGTIQEEVSTIVEEEEDNWMTLIIKCLEEGVWPTAENKVRTLRMKISQYMVEDGVLFKKSYLSPMLRCVGPLQANYIIKEVHEGACGMHAGASLTCGSEAVIPVEIGMPTYRTIHFNESQNEEEMRLNLDLSQERRETAAIREAKYKKKVEQYYNKRVRPMSFKVGDFVYRKNATNRVENQGKLGPNWEGPYRDNQVVVPKGMSELVFREVDGGCWIVLSAAPPKVTPSGEGASGCTGHNSLNDKSHESAIFWTYVRIKKLMLKIRSPRVVIVSS
uniref:Reverse transcriptase domain-containing protein n=1 Tax=Tanacetum cinerariifolium TaxID=118510 RepID=A0A699HTD4_TANCI|nr:hypothetical protein [Tanacetum cinerariifolium]